MPLKACLYLNKLTSLLKSCSIPINRLLPIPRGWPLYKGSTALSREVRMPAGISMVFIFGSEITSVKGSTETLFPYNDRGHNGSLLSLL